MVKNRLASLSTNKAKQQPYLRFLIKLQILSVLLMLSSQAFAQNDRKYLVLLKDKANSPYSIQNPSKFLSERAILRRLNQNIDITQHDLPVNPAYVAAIRETGAKVWYTSRWLNAVMVETDEATLETVKKLKCVKGLEDRHLTSARISNEKGTSTKSIKRLFGRHRYGKQVTTPDVNETLQYGSSLDQVAMLDADKMHQQGFRGEGMMVSIMDGGFSEADKFSYLSSLFSENRLVGTYDFVKNDPHVFGYDNHGTRVLSTMAAYQPGKFIGTAFKASYLLLRTEDVTSEYRIEEANWLFAAEYADSVGTDVISTSLGYSTFDDPTMDYTRADLNGDKALITRAADWAAAAGILVVTSAGNEGGHGWKYVTVPADGDSVMAVGSVDKNQVLSYFSSRGPTADKRIKPDVVAQGTGTVVALSSNGNDVITSNGTSFSAPVLAGMATGFWQANRTLTNMEVIDLLRRSASQAFQPDSLLGYGIPHFTKAMELALGKKLKKGQEESIVFPNPVGEGVDPWIWLGKEVNNQRFSASLVDIAGKVFWKGIFTKELNILPMSTLPLSSGLYFLRIESDKEATYSIKIVKNP